MKNTKDYYNNVATDWSAEWLKQKESRNILSKFYDCFAYGGTVHPNLLDLGCGAGYDSKILSDLGAKVVGVDIAEKNIEIAKQNVRDCKFFVGDITDPFTALGKFDGIICLDTIMHIDIDKMHSTLMNMAAVLKKGGLLLLSFYDGTTKDIAKSYVSLDGETYNKKYNAYSAEEICAFAYPKLRLVDNFIFNDNKTNKQSSKSSDGWKYFIFEKIN